MKALLFVCYLFPLLLLSQPQYEWAYGLGGPWDDQVTDIITDEYGNVYVTGSFRDFLRYDTILIAVAEHDTATNLSEDDAFVMKLSPSGRFLWAKSFGDYGYDIGIGLALSSDGVLHWGGNFNLTARFDSIELEMVDENPYLGYSSADIFLAQLDTSDGSYLSVRQLGGDHRDRLQWIAMGQGDDLWIGGTTASQNFTLGLNDTVETLSLFLAKYSASDSLLAVFSASLGKEFTEFPNERITSAAISKRGFIQVIVSIPDSFLVDGLPILENGGHVWLTISPQAELITWENISTTPARLTTGPEESVFLAGSFRGAVALDTIQLDGGEKRNFFTARFDSLGHIQWADHWPTASIYNAYVNDITFNQGNLYWVGSWNLPVFVSNGDTLISNGLFDGLVASYEQTGQLRWAKGVGGNSDNYLDHITLSPKGEIYTTGSFYSFITLADTIVIPNTFGGLDRFEYWIGKMQDSVFTTSLPASVLQSAIKVYPNPFQEQLHLEGLSPGKWQITCTNQLGQVVKEAGTIIRSPEEVWSVHMPPLPAGGYHLTLSSDTGRTVTLRLQHP